MSSTSPTEGTGRCSRRAFLAGAATAASGVIASTPAVGTAPSGSQHAGAGRPSQPSLLGRAHRREASSLGTPGTISPRGRKAIAAVDRVVAQQRDPPQRTVDAVSDLGLDPEGNTPINQAFEEAVNGMSNTRIEFPADGTFRVSGDMRLSPAGPLEIIGNGTTFQMDADTAAYAMNIAPLPSGSLLEDVVIDMSASGAYAGVRLETDGAVRVTGLTMRGYADPAPAESDPPNILVPVARTPEATIQITNFVAVGGTAAGMHRDPNKPASAPENRLSAPICLWVGQSTRGTVQLNNPQIRGWSNGTYSGRTTGRVEINGGVLWNNTNCQVRISGGSVCDGSTLILDDRDWSMDENPGPYGVGGNQGVNAVRIDPGGTKGNQTDPVHLRNLEVRGMSMEISSSLIDFEGSAGPGMVQNCRLVNHLDGAPAVWGERPGSQQNKSAAPQTNIVMDACRVEGNSPAPVMRADSRPASSVRRTCITIPDPGPEDITGAQIGHGVSFGQCTSESGLAAPERVGSNVSVSNLPAPNASYAGNGSLRASTGPSQEVLTTVLGGSLMIVLLIIGLLAVFVGGILSVVGTLAGMIGGD